MRRLPLTTAFEARHMVLTEPRTYGPQLHGSIVKSAADVAIAVGVACGTFARRFLEVGLRRIAGRLRGALLIGLLVTCGCGASPITPARIERAIATTFANLVHTQVSWLGLAPMSPSDFAATARCRRSQGGNAGSGEWMCTVSWKGPDRQQLRDIYDLQVTPDGCYAATVEGESLGGPMLTTAAGRRVRNLLYAFEGCFDKS